MLWWDEAASGGAAAGRALYRFKQSSTSLRERRQCCHVLGRRGGGLVMHGPWSGGDPEERTLLTRRVCLRFPALCSGFERETRRTLLNWNSTQVNGTRY